MTVVPVDDNDPKLPNKLMNCVFKKLTIDNQFASSLIGVTDALEVASVSNFGILDHHLALTTLLYDRDALVCLQWFAVLEPVEDIVIRYV